VAFDSSLVSPLRSASNLTATLPACATTPVPSADTDNLDDLVCFTCEAPLPLGHWNSRKSKFPLRDRHFRGQVTTRERSGLVLFLYSDFERSARYACLHRTATDTNSAPDEHSPRHFHPVVSGSCHTNHDPEVDTKNC